ncbi:MAG: hypothetical protein LBE85_06555 [Candidatus Accumulibacter sp.]|jgi:hypothetical protein|nr:hypothetical protein [Accumulibacter sp.]
MKTYELVTQGYDQFLAENSASVPTVSVNVFKPLKMLGLSVFCFRWKRPKSAYSRSF